MVFYKMDNYDVADNICKLYHPRALYKRTDVDYSEIEQITTDVQCVALAVRRNMAIYDDLPPKIQEHECIKEARILGSLRPYGSVVDVYPKRRKNLCKFRSIPKPESYVKLIKQYNVCDINKVSHEHQYIGPYWAIDGGRDVVDELIETNQLYYLGVVDEALRKDEDFMVEMCRIDPSTISAALVMTRRLMKTFIVESAIWDLNEQPFHYMTVDGYVYKCDFIEFISDNDFIIFNMNTEEGIEYNKIYGKFAKFIPNISWNRYFSEILLDSIETVPSMYGDLYKSEALKRNPAVRHFSKFSVEELNASLFKPIRLVCVFDVSFSFY